MNIKDLSNRIIKTGLCNYGSKKYHIFICDSDFIPGSGDYEDISEIANDRYMKCYCIYIEDIINIGSICASVGYYELFSEAIQTAEESAGFERWIN